MLFIHNIHSISIKDFLRTLIRFKQRILNLVFFQSIYAFGISEGSFDDGDVQYYLFQFRKNRVFKKK